MGVVPTELPRILPVFALSGALLLPGARLPFTVFEPRYLAMMDAVLGAGRLFALVQPGAVMTFSYSGGGSYQVTWRGNEPIDFRRADGTSQSDPPQPWHLYTVELRGILLSNLTMA